MARRDRLQVAHGQPPELGVVDDRDDFAEYLRQQRERTSPESVGLPASGRRRTPGLRREEIAQLAGVGLSWYTWLEQGHDITPSASVIDGLARVLDLDPPQRAHLFHLAGVALPVPAGDYTTEAPAELRDVVLGLEPSPAYRAVRCSKPSTGPLHVRSRRPRRNAVRPGQA